MYFKIKVKYRQLIVEAYRDFTRLYMSLYDVCILLHHIYISKEYYQNSTNRTPSQPLL